MSESYATIRSAAISQDGKNLFVDAGEAVYITTAAAPMRRARDSLGKGHSPRTVADSIRHGCR